MKTILLVSILSVSLTSACTLGASHKQSLARGIGENHKNLLTYKVDVGHGKTVDVVFNFRCEMVQSFPMLIGTDTGYGLSGEIKYVTPTKALVNHRIAASCSDLADKKLNTSDVISYGDLSTKAFLSSKALSVYGYLITADDSSLNLDLSPDEINILKSGVEVNGLKHDLIRFISVTVKDKYIEFLIAKKSTNNSKSSNQVSLKINELGQIAEFNVLEDVEQYY